MAFVLRRSGEGALGLTASTPYPVSGAPVVEPTSVVSLWAEFGGGTAHQARTRGI